MVELDVKITSGDLYDFLLRHSYNSVSGLLGAVIGALGVVVGISRQYWIYLILGVVILLYLPWTLFIKSKQQVANNPVFREPLHYVLDENGITISQGDSSTCQAWEDCLKAVSTGRSHRQKNRCNNGAVPSEQIVHQCRLITNHRKNAVQQSYDIGNNVINLYLPTHTFFNHCVTISHFQHDFIVRFVIGYERNILKVKNTARSN